VGLSVRAVVVEASPVRHGWSLIVMSTASRPIRRPGIRGRGVVPIRRLHLVVVLLHHLAAAIAQRGALGCHSALTALATMRV